MKWATTLAIGLTCMAAAGPVAAQWRDQEPGGRHAPMGFPGGEGRGRGPEGFPGGDGRGRPNAGFPGGEPRDGRAIGPGRVPPQTPPEWPNPAQRWGEDGPDPGWRAQQNQLRAGVRAREYVPLGQAIQSIRRRSAGRQLDANIEDWNGRTAYRVRWAAPNGHRIDYIVDARTGEILSADAATP